VSEGPVPDVFRILVVCTGNICRSPMAERLLARKLAARLGAAAARVPVESAGTWGHVGDPMEPHARRTLLELGADPYGFQARRLTPTLVAAADLVLTASREHRAAVAVMAPRASRRTFTLRELARLSTAVRSEELTAADPVERGRQLVLAAAAKRGLVPLEAPEDDDIDDPYGAPAAAFAAAAAEISAALALPLELLAPARRTGPAVQ